MKHLKTWIIAYDIRAPKRLIRVHKLLSKEPLALQYSVFVADLTDTGLQRLKGQIAALIDPAEDDIRFYSVPSGSRSKLMGRGRLPQGMMLFGQGAPEMVAGNGGQADKNEDDEEPDPA